MTVGVPVVVIAMTADDDSCQSSARPHALAQTHASRTAVRLIGIVQQIKSKQKLRQLIDFAKLLAEEDQGRS